MRKRKMRFSIGLYAFLIIASGARPGATEEADGGYAGAFYQVPAGARPTAMGGAYLAVSDDGAAPLFNPAGVANLKRPIFGTSYRAMRLDRTLGYITAITPVQGEASLGVHWLYAGSGSVAARDGDGDLLPEIGDISHNNHQFTILFAKRFERLFAVGINLSYLYSSLSVINTSSVGFDAGIMFYLDQLMDREKRADFPLSDMQVGLTVKHISKTYSWNSEDFDAEFVGDDIGSVQDDKVPIEVGLGLAARTLERKLLLATDLYKNAEQSPRFHAGAEYYFAEQLALRGGYSAGRLTAGTGYLFKLGEKTLLIDYAFTTDRADEGSEHIFSFDLQF